MWRIALATKCTLQNRIPKSTAWRINKFLEGGFCLVILAIAIYVYYTDNCHKDRAFCVGFIASVGLSVSMLLLFSHKDMPAFTSVCFLFAASLLYIGMSVLCFYAQTVLFLIVACIASMTGGVFFWDTCLVITESYQAQSQEDIIVAEFKAEHENKDVIVTTEESHPAVGSGPNDATSGRRKKQRMYLRKNEKRVI